jgi:DNA-binding PadR family transcriptional regulator
MQTRRIPKITHLQFLVLGLLRETGQPGRVIRDALAVHGIRRSAPAFYQLMARLERDRLVEGWYEQITAGGQAVTERRYRLRPAGAKLWTEACDFYTTLITQAAPGWSDA